MESEECWDKDDEPMMHFTPVLCNDLKENRSDELVLLQASAPDVKDLTLDSLSWENNRADIGSQGAMNSLDSSSFGEDAETKSTGSSSDFQGFAVGKYRHRKPKARFSYVYEDKKVYVTNVSFKVRSDEGYRNSLMHFRLKTLIAISFIQEQSISVSKSQKTSE